MCPAEASSPSAARQGLIANVEREAASAVVWLRGEHDLQTVAELSAVLRGAGVSAHDGLVVDLGRVRFIDAATIGAIVACRNALALQGRALVIRSPTTPVRRLLDICGLQSSPEAP